MTMAFMENEPTKKVKPNWIYKALIGILVFVIILMYLRVDTIKRDYDNRLISLETTIKEVDNPILTLQDGQKARLSEILQAVLKNQNITK